MKLLPYRNFISYPSYGIDEADGTFVTKSDFLQVTNWYRQNGVSRSDYSPWMRFLYARGWIRFFFNRVEKILQFNIYYKDLVYIQNITLVITLHPFKIRVHKTVHKSVNICSPKRSWYLYQVVTQKWCASKGQYLSFDMFKAFDYIESSHKSDF